MSEVRGQRRARPGSPPAPLGPAPQRRVCAPGPSPPSHDHRAWVPCARQGVRGPRDALLGCHVFSWWLGNLVPGPVNLEAPYADMERAHHTSLMDKKAESLSSRVRPGPSPSASRAPCPPAFDPGLRGRAEGLGAAPSRPSNCSFFGTAVGCRDVARDSPGRLYRARCPVPEAGKWDSATCPESLPLWGAPSGHAWPAGLGPSDGRSPRKQGPCPRRGHPRWFAGDRPDGGVQAAPPGARFLLTRLLCVLPRI